MKPIHECGVIKEGNERVAYLIIRSDTCTDNFTMLKHWKIVDRNTFEKLVQNNEVQFLIWDNNTIKCSYTQEEAKALKKSGMNREFFEWSIKEYWNMDLQFKSRHIKAASENSTTFACSLSQLNKTFGMYMIPAYIYGNIESLSVMVKELEIILGQSLSRCYMHNGVNIATLIIPYIHWEKLLSTLGNKYQFLFNTSTAKFILKNSIKLPKLPLIQSKGNPDQILSIINKFDRLTLDNEKKLGL